MEERDPQTYEIIGAAMEVHRTLGKGFLEPVYQEALAIEFTERQIPFERERVLSIDYKGRTLDCKYRVDFICFQEVIVEVKALDDLSSNEQSQVLNYLRAANLERGILLNFGQVSLQHRRFVRTRNSHLNPSS